MLILQKNIATLCNDGQLNINFLLYLGKSYWIQLGSNQFLNHSTKAFSNVEMTSQGKDFLQTRQFEKVNIFPIDVVFMLINRVNYTIEVDEEINSE